MNVADTVCCLVDYRNNPPDRTGKHGEWVSAIACYYASDSSFYFYLAANEREREDGEGAIRISQMAFARAIDAAIDHGVDVLNISAGRSRPNCTHGHCVYCSEAKRAVENEITVVASAGNNPDACVHCPSNETDVISVGGVEFECTFDMPRAPQNPTNKPPLAYWTRLWSGCDEYPHTVSDKSYCTTRGCWSEAGSCDDQKKTVEWAQNPISSGGKPDILAPVHYAEQLEEQYPFVWAASSFATPVVSGCLAGILSTVDSSPSPFAIQRALTEGSERIEASTAGIFDADNTRAQLSK